MCQPNWLENGSLTLFKGKVSILSSNSGTKVPRAAQARSPPSAADIVSSEYALARSENNSPFSIRNFISKSLFFAISSVMRAFFLIKICLAFLSSISILLTSFLSSK